MTEHKLYTLVFVFDEQRVLLGYKKRGFGEGRWNGFGGKVEPGESIVQGAIRELNEESGLIVDTLENVGLLRFEFDNTDKIMDVFVFKTNVYRGNPIETEEMVPQWFDIDKIPFDKMWPDDKMWFPLLLSGKIFKGTFSFKGLDIILQHNIRDISQLTS